MNRTIELSHGSVDRRRQQQIQKRSIAHNISFLWSLNSCKYKTTILNSKTLFPNYMKCYCTVRYQSDGWFSYLSRPVTCNCNLSDKLVEISFHCSVLYIRVQLGRLNPEGRIDLEVGLVPLHEDRVVYSQDYIDWKRGLCKQMFMSMVRNRWNREWYSMRFMLLLPWMSLRTCSSGT